ncbi:hypothetical protein [Anaerospora hongkongensis]|nr:hypothetical protein [Anaerospora hongkongensis]
MTEFWNVIFKVLEITGIAIQFIIALVVLAIAVCGGSISVEVKGIDRFFK